MRIEELEVIDVVLQNEPDTVLDVALCAVDDVVDISKTHFWFYHPELSDVSGSVRHFGSEGRTEGVDVGQCTGVVLHGQLP